MDLNKRITNLEQQLSEVESKRKALRAFMAEARKHESDVFSWLANQELSGDYPGKALGLTVSMDGQIGFRSKPE